VAPELEQSLEEKFMKPLDTGAALALEKIMSNDRSPWASEPRSAWTLYIMSLLFRNPATVKLIKDHIGDLWDAGVKAPEQIFMNLRLIVTILVLGRIILPRCAAAAEQLVVSILYS
jgi:hypothetical protein